MRKLLLATWAFAASSVPVRSSFNPTFDCNPCINRANHVIKAVVEGTKSDPFWKQVELAMRQTAKDMGVQLDLELYDTLDTDKMAADVRAAASANNPPEALIVTIPTGNVQSAVKYAVDSGTPVFGFYSGYEEAEELGTTGFIAMDQELAGENAANQFLKLKESVGTNAKVAFVTPGGLNDVFQKRLNGFLKVFDFDDARVFDADEQYSAEFNGCPFDFVLLARSELLEQTISAYNKHNCDFSNHLIGTFDTNTEVHNALSTGELAFAVSEEQYMQGAFSVMTAALFARTGKALSSPSDSSHGFQMVGPRIITSGDLPSDTYQSCVNDSFPVCPNKVALDGKSESNCPCIFRRKIKIAGVLHADTTDKFWDVVYESVDHAADDFGIDLELHRFEPQTNFDVLHEKMAARIKDLCKSGIDGLFVTIPNDVVRDEIEQCVRLNIPVISINMGADDSEELGLYHHIGMNEYYAGVEAGKRMAKAGIRKALCLVYAPNNVMLTDRCSGFKQGLKSVDPAIEHLGDLWHDDEGFEEGVERYVESKTGDTGNWQGIGIMLGGQPHIEPGLRLKEEHPSVVLGTFDSNELLYKALDEGKVLFGIDQGPYMQGYLPVALLTWHAYTGQRLSSHKIESGPKFIDHAPSANELNCESMHFPVCSKVVHDAVTAYAASQEINTSNNVTIISLSVTLAVLVVIIIVLADRVHALSKRTKKVSVGVGRKEYPEMPITQEDIVAGAIPSREII